MPIPLLPSEVVAFGPSLPEGVGAPRADPGKGHKLQAPAPKVPVTTSLLVFPADFSRFAEMYPDFAEEYLYPDRPPFESCAQTPLAPTPNGFCADFSPENSDAGNTAARKKLE